ncbi:winged helix-turn-helix domain-containing protein [Dokdonella sp.]|uniref:winged helix-turn-helix domain-containing protein n=1 Tax=Dokdonella sp. TaxID=2291710 RepID=UPI003C4B5CA6
MPNVRRYQLDDLLVDLDRQTVERSGARLDVAGLSFRLLAHLIECGDRVVSFDALIEAVWAPAVVGEETVTQRVKLLRQALGDDGRRPRYVRSVRGQGYQLCSVPTPESSDASLGTADRQPASRKLHWAYVIAAVLLLALLAGTAWINLQTRPVDSDRQVGSRGAATEPLQRALYYAGIGQDANNERAIDLFEDVLVDDPGNVEAMLGLSRALSARMCLYNRGTGSVKRAETLARNVLEKDDRNSRAHDVLAYSYDCRGYIDEALAEYERAVELDPVARFDSKASAAYLYAVKGRLADALKANLEVSHKSGALRFHGIQVARNLELLGFVAVAEQRYAQNFRLYPDSVYSNVAWPRSLYVQGRLAEAEVAIAEALARPPHPELFILEGELALLRGDEARARSAFQRAHDLRPHTSWPETLLHRYAQGAPDAAWMTGQAAQIRAAIDSGEHSPEMHIELAVLALGQGAKSRALDELDAAIEAGYLDRAYLQVSPLFKPLVDEPRFAAAIDRIGQIVARERAMVLAADWLPADLLSAVKASP